MQIINTGAADEPEFDIGESVVVEVYGRVVEQRRNARGLIYIVQPGNAYLPRIHAPAETVFPPDMAEADDEEGTIHG